jgi:hypothetical protein
MRIKEKIASKSKSFKSVLNILLFTVEYVGRKMEIAANGNQGR